jgi:NADH:ubiquinone oxidoreductase subunit F (NADH-binding)
MWFIEQDETMKKVRESRVLLGLSGIVTGNGSGLAQLIFTETPPTNMAVYREAGGYKALENSLRMNPEKVIATVKDSCLIGRGGAGFPTGRKWEMASRAVGDQKYFICNAEEGEPGTFKDRVLLERNPHQILEGIIIGAYAIGASVGYIYINGEFQRSIDILQEAIKEAQDEGYLGVNIRGSSFSFHLKLFRSMGAYVCGEETALLNSIEGKRGVPRTKPPYPTNCGLFQKPTVVNNVETLANIPPIILNGAKWYKRLGVEGSYGTKLFSISGNVKRPGVYEIELGKYTLSELIYGLAKGIEGDKKIKAILPGGASTRFLTNHHLNVLTDYKSLREAGSALGTGGIIVFDEDQNIPQIVKHLFNFYRQESCGVCAPCRLGTNKVYEILCLITEPVAQKQFKGFYDMYNPKERRYLEQVKDIAATLRGLSRCGLGQSASDPLQSSLNFFENEYLELIEERQREYEILNRRYTQLAVW